MRASLRGRGFDCVVYFARDGTGEVVATRNRVGGGQNEEAF